MSFSCSYVIFPRLFRVLFKKLFFLLMICFLCGFWLFLRGFVEEMSGSGWFRWFPGLFAVLDLMRSIIALLVIVFLGCFFGLGYSICLSFFELLQSIWFLVEHQWIWFLCVCKTEFLNCSSYLFFVITAWQGWLIRVEEL